MLTYKCNVNNIKIGGNTLKIKDMIICSLFAALMAVGANVAPFLTIGGIPITLQLLFAILAGGLLGSRLGSLAMGLYLLLGLIGAPVFAQFRGGIGSILSPTFGYVISFIFVAYVVGKLLEKESVSRVHYISAGMLAIIVNYIIGTNYTYFALTFWAEAPEGFSYIVAWSWMGAYLPIDIGVTIFALIMVPKLKKALNYRPEVKQKAA